VNNYNFNRPVLRARRLLPRGPPIPIQPPNPPKDRALAIRIRNREAAQRSDLRKQLKVRQLREETAKMGALRKRVAQLREENSALRQRLLLYRN